MIKWKFLSCDCICDVQVVDDKNPLLAVRIFFYLINMLKLLLNGKVIN
jgi:hypothetical protein